jgi:hypothetical protein
MDLQLDKATMDKFKFGDKVRVRDTGESWIDAYLIVYRKEDNYILTSPVDPHNATIFEVERFDEVRELVELSIDEAERLFDIKIKRP